MTLNPQALAKMNRTHELQALLDTYAANVASVQEAIEIRQANRPITHDQRRAMFPAFGSVFGSVNKDARKVFTRLVLGKDSNADVSWADNQPGTITRAEANKVIDALVALEEAL